MFTPKRVFAVVSVLVILSLVLAACTPPTAPPPATVIVTVPGGKETVVVTATPAPQPTEAPKPKTMVICQQQEPDTLYLNNTAMLAASSVWEALYDSPWIDSRTYAYQAVGVTQIPTFENGGAKKLEVDLKAGDKVYDAATDEVVTLPVTHEITLNQLDGTTAVLKAGEATGKAIQLEVTWTMVDGVKWEDGTPVTADDVVFRFQVQSSPDDPSAKYNIERTASFTKVDDKSWKWVSLPGYTSSTYFADMALTPLPKHLYDGKLTPAQMLADEQVNRKPLAMGPYKLDEWIAGDHITLSKNPNYWRAAEGLPKIDTLVYRFVPDTNQLIAQLASGECDLGTSDASYEGSLPLVKQFEAQGLLKAQIVGGTTYEHIDFDIMPIKEYNGFAGTAKNADGTPVFANAEIRQAIAYCMDRQAIIDQALNGAGVLQDVYIPAEHPLYAGDANIVKYPFDAAKGKALLEKNGWKDTDGDGIIDNGKGVKFSFVQGSTTKPVRAKVTQIIQAQLKDNCGIDTTIDLRPAGEFFANGPDGPVFGRKYDTGEFAWVTGVEPPCQLYQTIQIPNEEHGWGAQNNTGWSDAAFDDACKQGANALDPTLKKEQHALAQKLFSEAVPSIVLYAPAKICVVRPEITGVQMDPTQNSEMWNVENFDITTKP